MTSLSRFAVGICVLFGAVSTVSAQNASGRGVVSTFSSYSAEIQSDGNLRGVLQLIDSQLPVPGVVQISFIRNGRLIAKSSADENGVFQAQGLIPGTYSVVATAKKRFATFSLTVLPPRLPGEAEVKSTGFARANQGEFTVPLTAASDFQLISQVVQQETPPETIPTPPDDTPPVTTTLGGGGGGGGSSGAGGMAAAMLATAGTVGLGIGLADDDTPASPARP